MIFGLFARQGTWVNILTESSDISWSSDKDTLAVDLSFNSLISFNEGTLIRLYIDKKITFSGILIKKSKSKLVYTYTCFSYEWFLNKNETIIQFNKVSADVAIKQLCAKFGIKCNVVKINYIVQEKEESTKTSSKGSSSSGNSIVAEAKKYLGIKYVWGGTTPRGFDCSGLTQYVYGKLGINISRTTYTQIKEGTNVTKGNLQAGDLMFFGTKSDPHHVAIYIGNNQYIHAPSTGDVVKITTFTRNDFICGRRIKASVAKSTSTKTTTDTKITTNIAKIYKDMTLSAIIDDILTQAELELGYKYVKEMINETLYIRKQAEYKIFPKFILSNDLTINSSIEDMKNRVLVVSSDEKNNKILATASDAKSINNHGALQEVLTVDAKDISKAKNIATTFLKANNKVFRDTSLPVVILEGGAELRANRSIYIPYKNKGLVGWFNIKSVSCKLENEQMKADISIEW